MPDTIPENDFNIDDDDTLLTVHSYYLPEEELIQLIQDDIIDWVEYVQRYSPEWRSEFLDFCRQQRLPLTNESALAYIAFREDLLDDEIANGMA